MLPPRHVFGTLYKRFISSAYIAAKLALGTALPDLKNSVTGRNVVAASLLSRRPLLNLITIGGVTMPRLYERRLLNPIKYLWK